MDGSVCSLSVFSRTLIKTHREPADNTKRFLFVRARGWLQGQGGDRRERKTEGGTGNREGKTEMGDMLDKAREVVILDIHLHLSTP